MAEAHPTVPRALVAGLGRWPGDVPSSQEPGLLAQQADEPLPGMGAPVTVILVTPSSSEPTQDLPISLTDQPQGQAARIHQGPASACHWHKAPRGETHKHRTSQSWARETLPTQESEVGALLGQAIGAAHGQGDRGGCSSRGLGLDLTSLLCLSPLGQRSASLDVPLSRAPDLSLEGQ